MKKLIHRIAAVVLSMAVVSTLGNSILRADGLTVEKSDDKLTLSGSGTLYLGEDLTVPIVIEGESTVTINLNGYDITVSEGDAIVGSSSTVTINGSGSTITAYESCVSAQNVTINGGEYISTAEPKTEGEIFNIFVIFGDDSISISDATVSGKANFVGSASVPNNEPCALCTNSKLTISGCTINGSALANVIDASDTTFNGYVEAEGVGTFTFADCEFSEGIYSEKIRDGFSISATMSGYTFKHWKVTGDPDVYGEGTSTDLGTTETIDSTWFAGLDESLISFVPVFEKTTSTTTTTTTTTTPVHTPDTFDFVERLYHIALGRGSDEIGRNYWISSLNKGEKTGSEVAYGFFFSPEFIGTNYSNEEYVESLYNAILGRYSDPEGLINWVNALNNGMTREEVFNGFVTSPEFSELCSSYGVKA